MYLSRVELDCSKRETQKALVSLNLFHGALESAFTGARKRILWRIDPLGGKKYVLILSEDLPDFTSFQKQFGFPEKQSESLDYSKLLCRIKNGTEWRFRLIANPTRSAMNNNERGKIHSEVSQKYIYEWLLRKSNKYGFDISPDQINITEIKWYSFVKSSNNRVQFKAVTYEGLLKVTDSDLFIPMLTSGIGREKAYGMGMMTLIKDN